MTSPANDAWEQQMRMLAASNATAPHAPAQATTGPAIGKQPDLHCYESLSAWPWYQPLPAMNKMNGLGQMPNGLAPNIQQFPEHPLLPTNSLPNAAAGVVPEPSIRKPIRPSRMSEVDKLKARLSSLEETITSLRHSFEELRCVMQMRAGGARGKGGSIQMTAEASEHVNHGSTRVDHGSDRRREAFDLSVRLDDMESLANNTALEEFLKSL